MTDCCRRRTQPTYSEAVLVKAARLLSDLGELWAKATDAERTEIAQNLFSSIRVRDGYIVSAKFARDEYLRLVASAQTRVWMARPGGSESAMQTLVCEGVADLVAAIRAA